MNIEGFEFIEPLGEDAESVVWKARQLRLDRTVELHVYPAQRVAADRLAAIIRDVTAAARLKHPNLVQIYDVGTQDDMTYVVREHVHGTTLQDIVDAEGPLSNDGALHIAEGIAQALRLAWDEAHIVHGTLAPPHMVFDEAGRMRLASFDQSPCRSTADGGPSPALLRLAHFRSPEEAAGAPAATVQSDMYSLGAVLYYALTGVRPFDGHPPEETLALHVDDYLTNPRELTPALPAMTLRLMTRLLGKRPEDRYADWGAALNEIQAAAAGRIVVRKNEVIPRSSIDRRTSGTQAGPHPYRRADDARWAGRVPLWVRLPAWLLLLAFWGFLVYRQATQPIWTLNGSALLQRLAPRPTAPASGADPTSGADPVPKAAVAETAADADTPPAPQLSAAETARLQRVRQRAAAALLDGQPAAAKQAVAAVAANADSAALRAAAQALGAFIDQVSAVDTQVANAFKDRLDSELVLDFNGTSRRIVPRAISGNTIVASLVRGSGAERSATSVSFSTAELAPAEKLRWLAGGESDVLNTIRLLLHFQAGQLEQAKALAPACGPLARAFEQQL